ncbi:unnamed protein product [Darwinula stevensoni]|uniref:Large ribosomal subunit protein bL17m n=1 Tax=Darwinula stevensoni TaxID=69355 RepID=A0A7R8XER4_9CRUS|nr:unnamed protein product [Darwinula stevensoni]CAG0889816.1 unnamed protein product [Darwinula stevensoni]
MNQSEIRRLIPALKFAIPTKRRNLSQPEGLFGRMKKIRVTVGALIKYERIELNQNRADESRQYAERLISEAIRHGDRHLPTMELADFWLQEKQLIHKLFKVLVPRYQNFNETYTRRLNAPVPFPARTPYRVVLELKGKSSYESHFL